MNGPRTPPSWHGAKNYSGQPDPNAGRELNALVERGRQQADDPDQASTPARSGDEARGAVGHWRSMSELIYGTKPAGPADWETGWEKRAGIVAACIIGPIILFTWAKDAKEPSGPPPISVGSRVEVKQGFFGCSLEADIKQIEVLAFERHDATAASRYRQSHGCLVLNKGEVVEVSDMAPFSGLYCLRWRGDPDCYWFPEKFVRRPRPTQPKDTDASDF